MPLTRPLPLMARVCRYQVPSARLLNGYVEDVLFAVVPGSVPAVWSRVYAKPVIPDEALAVAVTLPVLVVYHVDWLGWVVEARVRVGTEASIITLYVAVGLQVP